MAKKRTYEQKLLDDLKELYRNKWYKIAGRADYDKMLAAIKFWIDCGEPLLISNDYSKIMITESGAIPPRYHKMDKLPEGLSIEKIERGHIETMTDPKGRKIELKHEGTSYRIYAGDKLIAIET